MDAMADSTQIETGDSQIEQPPQIEEESKEDFVIVDNTYLDNISEVLPLNNQSDFARVNPQTAQTDYKHLQQMASHFLIGPSFKTRP